MEEKENKVIFGRVADKENLCVIGVSDASYHQGDHSVAGEMLLLGSKTTKMATPMYWKSGVIRKVCLSPKAAETRGVVKIVDDGINMANQLSILLKKKVSLRVFTDLRPLLDSIGSSRQVEEKQIRQLIAYLKPSLEDDNVEEFSWIEGKEII